jgi:FkbM family methyltransferase
MRLINLIKTHSNWTNYYRYKYLGKSDKSVTFKTRSGLQIEVPKRMVQTYKECFFDEIYYKGLPKNYLKNQPTIVDVGANVGYFSLFTLTRFPKAKVISFEPMPMNFELLSKYSNENPALDFNPVNKAVSGEKGHITLQYDANDSFTTSASVFDNSIGSDTLKVETTTLEDVFNNYNLSNIDLLKLDCEGSEYSILYNSNEETLKKVKALSIETHHGKAENENKDSLLSFLQQKGFATKSEKDIVWAWR